MNIPCRRRHFIGSTPQSTADGVRWWKSLYTDSAVHTPGDWLICFLIRHDPSGRVRDRLLHWGFLDAREEGGLMFWRLDFWNATHRRWFKKHGL